MRVALETVPGVRKATVELETESAAVRWAPSEADGLDRKQAIAQMVVAIEDLGYKAWPIDATP